MSVSKKKIVVIGAGGHGSEIVSYLKESPRTGTLLGVIDDKRPAGPWNDTRVLGPRAELARMARRGLFYITAFGDNRVRKDIVTAVDAATSGKMASLTLRHASARVGARVTIGAGTLLAPYTVVTTNVSIGRHCILNVKASVSHDVVVEDFVNLNPGSTVTGGCHLGEGCFIGAGATLLPGVKIGKWATVGAGAVVLEDVPDFATVVGVPARELSPERRKKAG